GTLAVALTIDHSGYVPGENIIINAECINRSKTLTKETKVSLHQEIIYFAKNKKKKVKKEKCSKFHPGIGPGDADVWARENFLVPPLPPSGLPMCRIIDIKYTLHFSFIPSGMSLRLEVKAPIIIGTIPLKEVFANLTGSVALPRIPLHSPTVPPSWTEGQNSESSSASSSQVQKDSSGGVLSTFLFASIL
ncbi:Arrestin domain-containing protein 4, partial [Armadillidium nasatum]